MLVVIDESGCPGFKPSSSTHFVLGMVIFDTFSDAEQTANTIKALKSKIQAKREFHFSHCDLRKRAAFFNAIAHCNFRVCTLVVEKRLVHSSELRKNPTKFIAYFLRQFIGSEFNGLKNAIVKVDKTGGQVFEKGFKSYARQQVQKDKIKEIKFRDSKSDVLIQLADMVVSGYSRPYNKPNTKDAYRWKNMLDAKIVNEWKFR